ncbi:M24 family metallopeptidase [Paraburkholderia sp. Ac-20347]|uniref:M24 family metallopeptidase n=1 Tax=Paraburkholderia sp. Ac-20347 TaxID=2703892 RepID=UPI00197F17CB|nr:M24 family metallopeptidase [Paraburkholderia sp. Ac-20347]MBN3812511.1 M24 family metallopeptidase [Paraburkholderia sp. Ac-20347]
MTTGGYLDSQALRRLFAACPADALLACSSDSVFVASGHRTWLDEKMMTWMSSPFGDNSPRAGYAVVMPDCSVGLVANAVVAADASACRPAWLLLFGRGQPYSDPEAALVALLRTMGLAGKTIGWEQQALSQKTCDRVIDALPDCRFVDGSITWRLLKSVKSPAAIRALTRACELTEHLLNKSLPRWSSRGEPKAARRAFATGLAAAGAELDHFVWGMPDGGVSAHHAPPDSAAALFFDAGARVEGYYSDTGMTLLHAPCSLQDAQRYADAAGVLEAGRACLLTGELPSSAWLAMQSILPDVHLVAQGHGLGTSIREWPFFGKPTDQHVRDGLSSYSIDQMLVAGMVVNLEVAGNWPDGSSVQIEQTFLISGDGPRLLAEQPRQCMLDLGGRVCA